MARPAEDLHNPKMLNPVRDFGKAVKLNPQAWFKEMRENNPIRYDEERDGWDFFLYEDCQHILNNPLVFSSRRYPPHLLISQSLTFQDPPHHTELRNLVNRAFSPKMVADFVPRIESVTRELLDHLNGREQFDFMEAIAEPLPVLVIADMLGVDADQQEMFRDWALKFLQGVDSTDPEELKALKEAQMQAQASLFGYLRELIARRRTEPGTDLLSALTQSKIEGVPLTEDQLLAFCSILLVGGTETTMHLLSHAVRLFIEEPHVVAQLRERPELFPTAVEEILRYRPIVPVINRVAAQDTVIKGHQIRRGQGVVAWAASANRDPAKFENPDAFVIDRKVNPHLTFGMGVHYCLGAPLARLEATMLFQALLSRYKSFAYVPGVELEPVPTNIVNGVKNLPILVQAQKSSTR